MTQHTLTRRCVSILPLTLLLLYSSVSLTLTTVTAASSISALHTTAAIAPAHNSSAPSSLNRHLHSLPHCTIADGCHSLPFTADTDYMLSSAGLKRWVEACAWITLLPGLIVALYLIIDLLVRYCRYCCCAQTQRRVVVSDDGRPLSPTAAASEDACDRCCCRCCDDTYDDDQLRMPLVRADGFPEATVAVQHITSSSSSSATATAGSSPPPPYDSIYASSTAVHIQSHRRHPDSGFDRRTLSSLALLLIGLCCAVVALIFAQRVATDVAEAKNDVALVRYAFAEELGKDSVGSVVEDANTLAFTLSALQSAAANSSAGPLPKQYNDDCNSLRATYTTVATQVRATLQQELSTVSSNFDPVVSDMNQVERYLQLAVYIVVIVAVVSAALFVALHVYYRRRRLVSLCASTWLAFVVGLMLVLAAAAFSFAVGTSDACMAPLQYADSFLHSKTDFSSSLLHADNVGSSRGITPFDTSVVEFYLFCSSAAPTHPQNPLYFTYVTPLQQQLQSASVDDGNRLNDLQSYLSSSRGDLAAFNALLSQLNSTIWQDVNALSTNLDCEGIHNVGIGIVDRTCDNMAVNLVVFFATAGECHRDVVAANGPLR